MPVVSQGRENMVSENMGQKESVWDYGTGIPQLVRHRNSGRYYTRTRVCGRRKMIALKTDDWNVARLRHADTLAKAERQRLIQRRMEMGTGTMGDLLDKLEQDYSANTALAERSKRSLRATIERIVSQWGRCFGTNLRALKPDKIVLEKVRRFANFLHGEARHQQNKARKSKLGYKATTVNTTIEVIHRVLRMAVETGVLPALPFELNPVIGGPLRKPELQNKLHLPSTAKMKELFNAMRQVQDPLPDNLVDMRDYLAARCAESAEFAEFMAYSGARMSEAACFVWEDDMGDSIILRGTKTASSRNREVPKIPALRELLKRMWNRREADERSLKGRTFDITQCREALATACGRVGIDRLTHHSLRHFFATICIEAGVDIPTISRWMGHGDGGVLAMKTYGHLRREHSFAAAAKVILN